MENNNKSEIEPKTEPKAPEEGVAEKKRSDRILVWSIIILVVTLTLFFSVMYFYKRPAVRTIDDLNKLNIEGKLKPDEGYLYKGVYSFIKLGGLWYTQLTSPSGRVEYNIPFHFGPKELEDLKIEGYLDERFTNATNVYITFSPLGKGLSYVALAVGEFDQSLTASFGKTPVAACDRNETTECKKRPIVTCDDKDKAVVYFKEDEKTRILFSGNCITIQGKDLELVRAVDKVLLKWYGVID